MRDVAMARSILAAGRVQRAVFSALAGEEEDSLFSQQAWPWTLDTEQLIAILAAPQRPLKSAEAPSELTLVDHKGRRLCVSSRGITLETDIEGLVDTSDLSSTARTLWEAFIVPLTTLDRVEGSLGRGMSGYLSTRINQLDELLAALSAVRRLIKNSDFHHGLELEILSGSSHTRLSAIRRSLIERPKVEGALRELVAALAETYKSLFGTPSGRFLSSDSPFVRFAQAFLHAVGIRGYRDATIKDALYPRAKRKLAVRNER